MSLLAISRVIRYELKKFFSSSMSFFESVFYPMIFMLVAVPAIGSQIQNFTIHGSSVHYMYFALPGIMIYNAFSSAQYIGINQYISIVTGEMERFMTFPFKRLDLVIGKVLFSVIRSVLQAVVFLLICLCLYPETPNTAEIWLVYLTMTALFALLASALFFALACVIKSQNTFNIMVNMITFPLVFTSNALYSLENAPVYLRVISQINPLTYFISGMRQAAFMDDWYLVTIVGLVCLCLLPLFMYLAVRNIDKILG